MVDFASSFRQNESSQSRGKNSLEAQKSSIQNVNEIPRQSFDFYENFMRQRVEAIGDSLNAIEL